MSYLADTLHFSNQHDSDGEELVDVHVVVQSEKQANSNVPSSVYIEPRTF
jgi:hypothetical protein